MWEIRNDLLSFGDGDTAGNLETRPRVVVGYGVKFFFPVLQITSPAHLGMTHEQIRPQVKGSLRIVEPTKRVTHTEE